MCQTRREQEPSATEHAQAPAMGHPGAVTLQGHVSWRPWRWAWQRAGLRLVAGVLGGAALMGSPAMAAPAEPAAPIISLHYHVRPPFVVERDGKLEGLTGTPAGAAFSAAHVPFRLELTPAARFVELVKANLAPSCGVGWFRTPERESFAKFSVPLYRDEPLLVLASAASTRIQGTESLTALLSSPNLLLLTKQGYSYGSELDTLIDKYGTRREVVSVENLQMIRMVESRRADYMFVTAEEADLALAAAGLTRDLMRLFRPAGMPAGQTRHLMCSRQVSDAIMAQLDVALRAMKIR